MAWSRKVKKQKELRQPDMYISPVVKPRENYSRQEIIDSDATKIIQSIILPKLNQLHAMFPQMKDIELRVSIAVGARLEVLPVPFASSIYYLSDSVENLGIFIDTLKKVVEITSYYGIHSEKPKGASYRSFTKELDDDTIFYEKMMAYKNQELDALMEKAKTEKTAKEKAEAEAKAKVEEQARINEVLLYGHNCLQVLISSVQASGTANG